MANRNLASVSIFCALIIKISEQYPPATSTNMQKHNYLGGKSDLGLSQLSTMRQLEYCAGKQDFTWDIFDTHE